MDIKTEKAHSRYAVARRALLIVNGLINLTAAALLLRKKALGLTHTALKSVRCRTGRYKTVKNEGNMAGAAKKCGESPLQICHDSVTPIDGAGGGRGVQ